VFEMFQILHMAQRLLDLYHSWKQSAVSPNRVQLEVDKIVLEKEVAVYKFSFCFLGVFGIISNRCLIPGVPKCGIYIPYIIYT